MITVNTKEFKRALANCKTCWYSKTSLPVLQNVLIEGDQYDNLHCYTTNLERGIMQQLPGYLEGDNIHTTAPLKELYDYVSKVKRDKIKLDMQGKHLVLDDMIKLPVIEAAEFPPFPDVTDAVPNGGLAIDDMAAVVHAASTDDARPVLQGVRVTNDGMMATDGFRIAIRAVVTGCAKPIIIPADTIKAILKIEKAGDIAMRLLELQRQVVLTVSYGYIVSMLIEGNFPDAMAIVPKSTGILAMFDRAELIEAATMVGSMNSKDEAQIVRLSMDTAGCTIKNGSGADIPAERTISCDCNSCLDIELSWKFLIEVLKVLTGDTVMLQFNAHNTPLMIAEGRHTEVIMPMHLG